MNITEKEEQKMEENKKKIKMTRDEENEKKPLLEFTLQEY